MFDILTHISMVYFSTSDTDYRVKVFKILRGKIYSFSNIPCQCTTQIYYYNHVRYEECYPIHICLSIVAYHQYGKS